jgi:hypothetical protein
LKPRLTAEVNVDVDESTMEPTWEEEEVISESSIKSDEEVDEAALIDDEEDDGDEPINLEIYSEEEDKDSTVSILSSFV